MTSGKTKQERVRKLRDEALALAREGHDEKALFRLAELEKLEPNEPDWPRRAAECHRSLGNSKEQVDALGRAAERYMSQGLVPKAIATCRMILSIDPRHTATQERLGALNDASPARFPVDPRPRPATAAPSAPVPPQPAPDARMVAPRAPRLDEILRKRRLHAPRTSPEPRPEAPKLETSTPAASAPAPPLAAPDVQPAPAAEFGGEEPPTDPLGRALELQAPIASSPTLFGQDAYATNIETVYKPNGTPSGMFRITFPEPTAVPAPDVRRRAQTALPTTPLFSELSPQSLSRLIEEARLVVYETGSVVYRKDDVSDALYVIVSGAVAVLADEESRLEITRLAEGECFGETALVGNEPRLTTVEATEHTELLRIDRKLIAELVLTEPRTLRVALRFLRERLVQALLLTNPLFTGLAKGRRRELSERFEFLQVDDGSLLVEQGSPSPGLYVLLSGVVEVTRRENDAERRLSLLHAGAVFGEMSLISGEPAMADVRSVGKDFALRLPEWGFQDMGEDHPPVLEFLTLLAAARQTQNRAVLESEMAKNSARPPAPSVPGE
jgi:CRP-like cAMP-binding protein